MTNTPITANEPQKPATPVNPATPAQNPQQQTQGDTKPNADKPASQPQQK